MLRKIIAKIVYTYCRLLGRPKPEGIFGLWLGNHREVVGGKWNEIGMLQFEFMVEKGLKPHHILLDVGCGSLRGGVHYIKYLDKGHYLGIDKNKSWLDAGIKQELGEQLFEEKCPEFVYSNKFEFKKFTKVPQYAIAQSLLTHLDKPDINLCLTQLREMVNVGCLFYASFLECADENLNSGKSHSLRNFQYTQDQMRAFGNDAEWNARYIGDWGHPRGQKMMEYTAI